MTKGLDEGQVVVTDKIRCEIAKPNGHHLSAILLGRMSATALYPPGTAPVKAEFVQSVATLLFFLFSFDNSILDTCFRHQKIYNPRLTMLWLKKEPTMQHKNVSKRTTSRTMMLPKNQS
jgi:hypothetical protein